MKFEEILLEEPKLIPLAYEAYKVSKFTCESNRSEIWYREFKPQMLKLVGFECHNPKLCSAGPYDMIYSFFIELMKL